MQPIYQFENVSKVYETAEEPLNILNNINLEIMAGESVAIVGASGCGKSTLLHLMGALDKPTAGKILFDGSDISQISPEAQARFRNRSLGFVFQFHLLLPEFTALENVAMPGLIAGKSGAEARTEARALLERVGMAHRLASKPATLSGGERQRCAIARALLLRPRVVLADEPTGNLDENTGRQVGALLLELNRDLGITLVTVTHNPDIAASMDRTLELRAGALYEKTFA